MLTENNKMPVAMPLRHERAGMDNMAMLAVTRCRLRTTAVRPASRRRPRRIGGAILAFPYMVITHGPERFLSRARRVLQ